MKIGYAKRLEMTSAIFSFFSYLHLSIQATAISADNYCKGDGSRKFLFLFLYRLMAYVPPDNRGDFGLRKEVKLLVVDDHADHFAQIQAAAEEYHSEFNIECKLVSSAQEALQITNDWHPSVVLVDLHVVATTLELLTQLAESGPSVVATSERRIADLSEKLARYGAVGYVTRADSTEDIESVLSYLASLAAPETIAH